MAGPFMWGAGGQAITTPEQAKRQRAIAEALIGQVGTARNWAEGLADLTGTYAGSVLNDRAGEAETAGALEASGLYNGLSSSSPEQDIIAALSNPWASPQQSAVAQALLGQQFSQNDPLNQLRLQQAQLDYDQDLAGDTGTSESFFGTPIFTQDDAGNLSINQLGNQGSFNQVSIPEGQTLAPPTKEVDAGTEIITFDRFGNELFRTPKNLSEVERLKKVGAGLGDAQIEVINAGRAARSNNAKLDILEQTLTTAPQGIQGALVQAAGKIGIPMEGLDDVQAANAIISSLVPLQRLPGSGTMSDADLQLYRDSLPAILNQPGGNKKIISTLRGINDYVEQVGDIELDLATNKITPEQADAKYRALKNPLANFNASTAPAGATTVTIGDVPVSIWAD